jgi:hypothetical protein
MQDSLEYKSPVTNSTWLIYFDEDLEVTGVYLNGKNVTGRIRKQGRKNYNPSYMARLIEMKFEYQMDQQMTELLYEVRNRKHFFEPEY